jgi:hypothetical protein
VAELDVQRNLERFCSKFDGLWFLLNAVSFSVFYFQGQLRTELVFLLGTERDLNLFLLARLDYSIRLGDLEFLRETFDAGELPLNWDRANVLQCQSLG